MTQVTPPDGDIVELTEVKKYLHVDTFEDDDNIRILRDAAQEYIDGRDGILGRAIRQQSWRLDAPCFPSTRYYTPYANDQYWLPLVYGSAPIRLPLPPTVSVDSVEYVDTAGTLQTWASSNYDVIEGGHFGDIIKPVSGTVWPSTRIDTPNAVQITFTAGYDTAASPNTDNVPASIRMAIMILIKAFYDHSPEMDIPDVVLSLLAPQRLTYLG